MSLATFAAWLDRVDPGVHRRIKGLRLVTAYGIAALLGALHDVSRGLTDGAALSLLAGGFALWASVSEARETRAQSSRDLAIFTACATLGATVTACLTPWLAAGGRAVPELTLVLGAFAVGYARRFGPTGAGIGSQFFIGQLLAYGAGLTAHDWPLIVAAGLISTVAAVIPRLLSGPAERPVVAPPTAPPLARWRLPAEFVMGLQAALAALLIVALNAAFTLTQSAWAMAACTYVVTNTAAGTIDRIRRRIIGTAIGLPLGLACLPIAEHAPIVIWAAAALAMVVYAMALPERYDIACGAYTFTLIVTLAASGQHALPVLAARFWETVIGGALGLAAATLVFPLKDPPASPLS